MISKSGRVSDRFGYPYYKPGMAGPLWTVLFTIRSGRGRIGGGVRELSSLSWQPNLIDPYLRVNCSFHLGCCSAAADVFRGPRSAGPPVWCGWYLRGVFGLGLKTNFLSSLDPTLGSRQGYEIDQTG